MPLYYYLCISCNKETRRILSPQEASKTYICECGSELTRNVKPASSNIVETLDNGTMARKLERVADAERVYQEHRDFHEKKDKGG